MSYQIHCRIGTNARSPTVYQCKHLLYVFHLAMACRLPPVSYMFIRIHPATSLPQMFTCGVLTFVLLLSPSDPRRDVCFLKCRRLWIPIPPAPRCYIDDDCPAEEVCCSRSLQGTGICEDPLADGFDYEACGKPLETIDTTLCLDIGMDDTHLRRYQPSRRFPNSFSTLNERALNMHQPCSGRTVDHGDRPHRCVVTFLEY